MKTKQEFFQMLSKYELDVINFLLNNPNRLILIRGDKFIGKTTIIETIFNLTKDIPIIYHTGCDPEKRKIAFRFFKRNLALYEEKKCLVVLDEFYYINACNYFRKHKNFKVLLFVNSDNLTIDGFKHLNLVDVYEDYKKHFFKNHDRDWKNKNIRELVYMFDNPNYAIKAFEKKQIDLEKLRHLSNFTQTKIKENNKIHIETITFYMEN